MLDPIIWHVLEFVVACIALALCSHLLIKSVLTIARFMRISEFAAAFLIMATATSLPELFVGISSAFEGHPALALGTVIGSNIADLTLVMGVALLIGRHLQIKNKGIRRDAFAMILIAGLPLILMLVGKEISRVDGFILVCVFVVYQWHIVMRSKRFSQPLDNQVSKRSVLMCSSLLLITLVGLYLAAEWVVSAAIVVSADLLIPPILISVITIALGTSLPELAFETASVVKKHGELALGDLIGSVITNSTLVLGVTALIAPISSNFLLFATSAFFMMLVTILFTAFVESDHLNWKVGLSLVLMYIFFVIVELQLKAFA